MSPRAPGAGHDRVLAVLQSAPGHTIPTRDLMAAAHIATLEALRTHISQARQLLGDQSGRLQAVRGAGYRWDQPEPATVPADEFIVDLETGTASLNGHTVELTRYQSAVLQMLVEADGKVLDAELLQRRTGISSVAAVKIHISELRKALEPLPVEVATVRGQGYRYRGAPAWCLRPRPRPMGSLHISDGQVLRDGEPLRLRQREKAVLELLLERTGQPISYLELRAYANIPDIAGLQTAISSVRIALLDSPIRILHCGQGSDAYMLRVGTR